LLSLFPRQRSPRVSHPTSKLSNASNLTWRRSSVARFQPLGSGVRARRRERNSYRTNEHARRAWTLHRPPPATSFASRAFGIAAGTVRGAASPSRPARARQRSARRTRSAWSYGRSGQGKRTAIAGVFGQPECIRMRRELPESERDHCAGAVKSQAMDCRRRWSMHLGTVQVRAQLAVAHTLHNRSTLRRWYLIGGLSPLSRTEHRQGKRQLDE